MEERKLVMAKYVIPVAEVQQSYLSAADFFATTIARLLQYKSFGWVTDWTTLDVKITVDTENGLPAEYVIRVSARTGEAK